MKTILITGATDGIGLETAKLLVKQGHNVLLHGRNSEKLHKILADLKLAGTVEGFLADLSDLAAVKLLAEAVKERHQTIDVLINNAGVLKTPNSTTADNLDIRFVVNCISPYYLTKSLLPIINDQGRVINLSSAAQAPVNLDALSGQAHDLDDMAAYAQSKLAITMWSRALSDSLGKDGPAIIAVNPGSLLGSKMVKQGFGIEGKDLSIGADILVKAALSDEFSQATGLYFDNDTAQFSNPHPHALQKEKCDQIFELIESTLKRIIE